VSLSVRWHRLEAATWVHRLLVLWVVLLGLLTAVICIGGLMVGAPLMWILPAVMTALAGWIASAWGEGRRWSGWAVTALSALGAVSDLLGLASGISGWAVARLVLEAAFLALLAHPDSTARLARRPDRRAAPRWVPDRPPSG
jgi:hypothetical protein